MIDKNSKRWLSDLLWVCHRARQDYLIRRVTVLVLWKIWSLIEQMKTVFLGSDGYIVLRFLAEDVSKRLDMVLDVILRVLYKNNPNQQTLVRLKKINKATPKIKSGIIINKSKFSWISLLIDWTLITFVCECGYLCQCVAEYAES